MNNKILDTITLHETFEVRSLFELKNSLEELLLIAEADILNEVETQYQDICLKYNQWWKQKSKKYGWQHDKNHHFEINFVNSEVSLVENIV